MTRIPRIIYWGDIDKHISKRILDGFRSTIMNPQGPETPFVGVVPRFGQSLPFDEIFPESTLTEKPRVMLKGRIKWSRKFY
jgi:hypothetical protein